MCYDRLDRHQTRKSARDNSPVPRTHAVGRYTVGYDGGTIATLASTRTLQPLHTARSISKNLARTERLPLLLTECSFATPDPATKSNAIYLSMQKTGEQ
jgi:hypothetical protein